MRGLASKVAVVAGGGSGIGAATAQRLGEEGAAVVVGDLSAVSAERVASRIVESGGTATAVPFDISSEQSVDGLIRAALQAYGGIDCVHVNAADMSAKVMGIDGVSDVQSVPLDVFDRVLDVNLRGHVLMTRRAIPELLARGGGTLVYTNSVSAFMGEPVRPSYAIAKAGLLALVRHVASRWGPNGIRANGVAPGLVITERIAQGMTAEREEEFAFAKVRSSRFGAPSDVAAAVAFLCSDDAEWINGQTISVDGGYTMR